jgi:hypothetical protein
MVISTKSFDIHPVWRPLIQKITIGRKKKEDTVRRSDRLIEKEKRLANQQQQCVTLSRGRNTTQAARVLQRR